MKTFIYVLIFSLIAVNIRQSTAQTLTPVLQWSYSTDIPTGANILMDYDADICVGAYSSVPGGSAFLLDNAGNVVSVPESEDVEWVEPVNIISRTADKTFFLSTNLLDKTSTIRTMDNISLFFLYHTISWQSSYDWVEIIAMNHELVETVHQLTILVDVFDASINRNKVVIKKIDFDILTNSFAEYEEIAFLYTGKNTYPKAMFVNAASNIFIWGDYDKNVAGTNKDMFLARISPEGDIIFNKSYASYNGRDDNAVTLVPDNAGNLYGLASSEDNVAPYNRHIAVLKLNTNNGKMQFIKRIGEATDGSEAIYSASGNTIGSGLVFSGSVADGAGGRNGKVWRMNSSGATMWQKTFNYSGAGTVEESRVIAFHPISGSIYTNNISQGLYYLHNLNAATGANIYSPYVYEGDATIMNEKGQIEFSGSTDIFISSVTQVGLGYKFEINKISEIELRKNIQDVQQPLTIYPNPTAYELHLNAVQEAGTIQISNTSGQVVLEQSVNVGSNSIVVQALPAGQYFLNYKTGTGKQQQLPFIISK